MLAEVISDSYNELVKTSDFNELKAVVHELADAQKRTEQRVEALAVAQQKTDQRVAKLTVAQQKTEKELRNLARQVGGLSESFGGSLEDFAIDLVPELLEKHWQMHIDDAGRDEFDIAATGQTIEIDLAIRGNINGQPVLVLGEVKSNLTASEVERFIRETDRIKASVSESESPQPEIRVIFFGYRAKREARELVKAKGAYIVFTHGKIL